MSVPPFPERATAAPRSTVTAVVVNYNGERILKDCLASLLGQDYPDLDVILVDNGSADGSVPLVRERFPRVKVVECGANLGYAEGCNVGVREATGEFVVLVNTDARLDRRCVASLVEAMRGDATLAAVQGKVLRQDSPQILDSIGSLLTSSGFLYHVGDGKPDTGVEAAPIFTTRGVCMMVRRDLFHRLGGFDSDFFAYFEETDFCWRAWIGGYTVRLVPASVTFHLGSATTRRLPKPFIEFHAFKNNLCSILKNGGPTTVAFMAPLHVAMCLGILAGLMARRQAPLAGAVSRALVWNLAHLRPTLLKRRSVQSQVRTVRDRAVFATCLRVGDVRYYLARLRGALDKYEDAGPPGNPPGTLSHGGTP